MKTLTIIVLLTSILMVAAIGCDKSSIDSTHDEMSTNTYDNSVDNFSMKQTSTDTIETDTLSLAEIHGLLYMREEEKLARDSYTILFKKWNLRPFSNITRSEQMHMNAIVSLLKSYSLQDPVGQNGPGVFKDTVLQNLYTMLYDQGKKSITDALKVGATIEEVDIVDLQKHLKETSNQNITFVYANLMRGSRNHLRAFVRNLKARGISYVPHYLTATEFEQIISGSMERGCGNSSN